MFRSPRRNSAAVPVPDTGSIQKFAIARARALPGSSLAKQLCLRAGRRFNPELAIGVCGGDAPLRRPFYVAFHDQIGLVDFLNCAGFFSHRDRERSQSNGAAVEFMDQGFDDAFVPLIESVAIDL